MTDNQYQLAARQRWNEARAHGPLNVDLIEQSGKSARTFYRHKKKGPPKRKSKPWLALGISKSTYYYRMNKNKFIPSPIESIQTIIEPSAIPLDGNDYIEKGNVNIKDEENDMGYRDIPADILASSWESHTIAPDPEDIQPTIEETFVHHPRSTIELPAHIQKALAEYNARLRATK